MKIEGDLAEVATTKLSTTRKTHPLLLINIQEKKDLEIIPHIKEDLQKEEAPAIQEIGTPTTSQETETTIEEEEEATEAVTEAATAEIEAVGEMIEEVLEEEIEEVLEVEEVEVDLEVV
jgi:hypothetical protein